MTNRARPTWPEGAADNSKAQRPPQGGKNQSTAPATSASNGRSGAAPGGQQRTGTPNGQPSGDFRPPPRPGSAGAPGAQPAQGQPAQGRPPQQPPVRPGQSSSPGQAAPSTPGRPEPWSPPGTSAATPAGAPAAGSSYGQTGKAESFGDRVSAARQAVLDKAAAAKDAKAAKAEQAATAQSKATTRTEKAPKASTRPQTRKARLRMARIDPWSVMKTAFLLSIAFGIVVWVAVFIVWSAIGAAGVFDNINNTVTEVLGTPGAEPFRIENYINTGKVMGFTTLLACADVLIITALATLGSFLYNIAATLLGGLEVTLASED